LHEGDGWGELYPERWNCAVAPSGIARVRPEGTEGWTEDQLVEILTRDCLIGVALPKVGVTTNAVTETRPAIHPA
jgi:Nitrile hydratase, alpha chain